MVSYVKTLRDRVERRALLALKPYTDAGVQNIPQPVYTAAMLDALIAELGYEDDPTLPVSREVEDRV